MDCDRRSAQLERLEVVDTGRRRRWFEDEKLKIVLESLQGPPGRCDGAAIWPFALTAPAMATVVPAEPKDAAHQPGFVAVIVVAEFRWIVLAPVS